MRSCGISVEAVVARVTERAAKASVPSTNAKATISATPTCRESAANTRKRHASDEVAQGQNPTRRNRADAGDQKRTDETGQELRRQEQSRNRNR